MAVRRRGRGWVLGAAGVAVLAAGVGGYYAFADSGPRLSGGGMGVGARDTVKMAPYVVGSIPLCLDRAGEVIVKRVTVTGGEGGIEVQGFAVRRLQRVTLGPRREELSAAGFHTGGSQRVTVACSIDSDDGTVPDELAVQFTRTGAESGVANGLRVEYLSDGDVHTVDLEVAVSLCAPRDEMCGR